MFIDSRVYRVMPCSLQMRIDLGRWMCEHLVKDHSLCASGYTLNTPWDDRWRHVNIRIAFLCLSCVSGPITPGRHLLAGVIRFPYQPGGEQWSITACPPPEPNLSHITPACNAHIDFVFNRLHGIDSTARGRLLRANRLINQELDK